MNAKKYHFIAIGGSAMHNLAIALHLKGYQVSGSDDEIVNPARDHLAKYGLLPAQEGWFPERIGDDLEAVILGMHARKDNPELLEAQRKGIPIYSYPEFLYEQSKDKLRVVIGGSHGKTTITSMILHVLQNLHVECDYMVGAQLKGFEVMVRLSDTAKIMVLEGDEYLTSPIDLRPKFHLYRPHIAVVNGIAWDHINVFPTFEIYTRQFLIFGEKCEPDGIFFYFAGDKEADKVGKALAQERRDLNIKAYTLPDYIIQDDITYIRHQGQSYGLKIFGKHNLQNLQAAWEVCKTLGISDEDFLKSMQSFAGASKRLELVGSNAQCCVYKDFAHSPSKLTATIAAVREQYPTRKLVACMELHTFSSLTQEFLKQYRHSMDLADVAVVYFNPHAIALKKLSDLSVSQVYGMFEKKDLMVFNESRQVLDVLKKQDWKNTNLLWMTSGNFDGVKDEDLKAICLQ